jgi:hypothetical protein
MIRWSTLKGLSAIILFLVIAVLSEYVIVLYAINLGVKDATVLQWDTQLLTVAISPLFHLVPMAVIIALVFSWTYLTKYVTRRPSELAKWKYGGYAKRGKEPRLKFFGKLKSAILRVKGFAYFSRRIHFARAAIKGALTVLLTFGTFVFIVSLLAFPTLIPQAILNLYYNNPAVLSFMKNTAEALAPIGNVFSSINNALLAAGPAFRGFVSGLGNVLSPLTSLDNVGKYLAFQNAAAWITALTVLFYGELRKTYRHTTRRA